MLFFFFLFLKVCVDFIRTKKAMNETVLINPFNLPWMCVRNALQKKKRGGKTQVKWIFSSFFNDKYQVLEAFVNQMFTNIIRLLLLRNKSNNFQNTASALSRKGGKKLNKTLSVPTLMKGKHVKANLQLSCSTVE